MKKQEKIEFIAKEIVKQINNLIFFNHLTITTQKDINYIADLCAKDLEIIRKDYINTIKKKHPYKVYE